MANAFNLVFRNLILNSLHWLPFFKVSNRNSFLTVFLHFSFIKQIMDCVILCCCGSAEMQWMDRHSHKWFLGFGLLFLRFSRRLSLFDLLMFSRSLVFLLFLLHKRRHWRCLFRRWVCWVMAIVHPWLSLARRCVPAPWLGRGSIPASAVIVK